MIIERAYEITIPADERRSSVFGYFKNSQDGLRMASGKGWYGSDGHCNGVDVMTFTVDGEEYSFLRKSRIHVYKNEADYELKQQAIQREKALNKLTLEERKLLGLEK